MTQPAATKLLHELEQALNVELFERSRRGMKPTVFGVAMIRRSAARC
jgi:DNA-binding transcriptional LysR family regulator